MKAVCREPSCEDKDPCARDDTLDELADARLRQRVRVQKAVGSSLRTVCTSPPSLGSVPAAPSAGGGSRAGPRLASRPGTLHGIRGADAGGRFTLWPTSGSQGHRAGGLYSALSANTRLLLSCWATPEDSSLSHAASGMAGHASAAGHSRHVPSPRSSASELQTHSPGPPCGAEDEDAPQRRAGWAAPQPLLPGHGGPQAPKPLPAVSPAEPRPLRPQPLPGRRPRGGRLGRPSPRSSWS